MYGSLRFRDLKLGIHVPFSPCSRNPLHSFIPVVSVNLQDEKKKFELKKKKLKSSLRYFDSLKIKLAFIMSKLVIKIQDQKHWSQKGGIFLFRKPSNINLQAGNSQPNLHIRAIGMPMYWLGFAIQNVINSMWLID